MSDSANVIRSYLVSLGFSVDQRDEKKASASIQAFEKKVAGLTKGAIGMATAVKAMVDIFAFQMEKLYYASKKTDTTVDNLQAMEYGFKQIGGQAGQLTGALSRMAGALRSNPGLTGLLNSLGVKVSGRDKSDVMMDLVGQLRKMPFFVAERYANLFGIDSETLYTLMQGYDTYKKIADQRREMARQAGFDSDASAESATRYAQSLRELWERLGLVKDVTSAELLPAFQKLTTAFNDILGSTTKFDESNKELSSSIGDDLVGALRLASVMGNTFYAVIKTIIDAAFTLGKQIGALISFNFSDVVKIGEEFMQRLSDRALSTQAVNEKIMAAGGSPSANPSSVSLAGPGGTQSVLGATDIKPGGDAASQARLSELEQKYALPAGLLDRVWAKESGRGRNMVSPAGAEGHFQFMPATAKQYGLQNPYSFQESSGAAARKYADLFKMYGGDAQKAAAAYNWGEGNVNKAIAKGGAGWLGYAPKETQDYVKSVAGQGGISQTNTITVNGVSDPKQAADGVQSALKTTNADLVRMNTPRVS